jgi:hypothetical protein
VVSIATTVLHAILLLFATQYYVDLAHKCISRDNSSSYTCFENYELNDTDIESYGQIHGIYNCIDDGCDIDNLLEAITEGVGQDNNNSTTEMKDICGISVGGIEERTIIICICICICIVIFYGVGGSIVTTATTTTTAAILALI